MCSFYGSTNAWGWQIDAFYVHSFHVSQNSNTISSQGNQITRNRWLYKFGSSVWICFVLLWVHERLVQIGHTRFDTIRFIPCTILSEELSFVQLCWLIESIPIATCIYLHSLSIFPLFCKKIDWKSDLHNKTKIYAIRWNDLVFALEYTRFKLLSDALCSFINDNFNSNSQIK